MDITEALEVLIDCSDYVNDPADANDVEKWLNDSVYTYDGAKKAIEIVQIYTKKVNLPNRHRLI
tara:strand:+ start:1133 stop:1324 length:192 start_codon:yes stop_codon:yes gene_type:complete